MLTSTMSALPLPLLQGERVGERGSIRVSSTRRYSPLPAPLAAAVRGRDALLFNISAPDDSLRREVCAAEIVHTLPSLAMSMDALVQVLVARNWRDVIVLEGPLPADAAGAAAFERSAKKFGA